ncbi:MAG: hypothetical protein PUC65_00340 [Clostridiales bacterium]|nr:hypothetical protein [Clostridiales bacterium]
MESKSVVRERIQKSSKVLCILIKFAQIACYIGIGVLFVGLIWVLVNGNLDLLVFNGKVIIKSPFSSEFLQNADVKELIMVVVSALVRTIMMGLLLRQAESMFKDINANGSPFQMEHVKSIRKIAIFFFVMVMCHFDQGNTIKDLSYDLDFTGIVAAAILWCVSIIFEYGCLLQNESDETL